MFSCFVSSAPIHRLDPQESTIWKTKRIDGANKLCSLLTYVLFST